MSRLKVEVFRPVFDKHPDTDKRAVVRFRGWTVARLARRFVDQRVVPLPRGEPPGGRCSSPRPLLGASGRSEQGRIRHLHPAGAAGTGALARDGVSGTTTR
jgi:hypothetical protein